MGFKVIRANDVQFETRPHEPDEPARHAAEVTSLAGFQHTRSNVFRFEPGAKGRRHSDTVQEETYVPVRGTLTMYLDDPPERHQVSPGGLIHVEPHTVRQVVNEGDEELLVYIYGAPPERGEVEFLDSAV